MAGPFVSKISNQLVGLGLQIEFQSQDHGVNPMIEGQLPKEHWGDLLSLFIQQVKDRSEVQLAIVDNYDFIMLLPEPSEPNPLKELLKKRAT